MSNNIGPTGEDKIDFPIYLIALTTYLSPHLLELTSVIDFLCKLVSLVGFIFVAINQGYKFFKRKDATTKE